MEALDVTEKLISIVAALVGVIAAVITLRASKPMSDTPPATRAATVSQDDLTLHDPYAIRKGATSAPPGVRLARRALFLCAVPFLSFYIYQVAEDVRVDGGIPKMLLGLGITIAWYLLHTSFAFLLGRGWGRGVVLVFAVAVGLWSVAAFVASLFEEFEPRINEAFIVFVPFAMGSYAALLITVIAGLVRRADGYFDWRRRVVPRDDESQGPQTEG